jgi:hypothetical protein
MMAGEVSRAVFNACTWPVLTEISLCRGCSCQDVEDGHSRAADGAQPGRRRPEPSSGARDWQPEESLRAEPEPVPLEASSVPTAGDGAHHRSEWV